MFIEHLFYQENEANQENRIQIRDRFIEYFQDLHHRYHIPLDKKTIPSFGYRHHELGNRLFDLIKEKINVCECDYIIFPSWGVPIDPDYASHELHYQYQFGLTAQIMDVRDCGSLCVFHALDLISQLMKFQTNQCILCCSVETAGSPSANRDLFSKPEMNFISALQISKNNRFSISLEIIDITTYFNHHASDFGETVYPLFLKHKIDPIHCIAYVKSNSHFFNLTDTHQQYLSTILKITCKKINYKISSGFIYFCLKKILQNLMLEFHPFILIIDEDAESSATGMLLLKMHKDKNCVH